MSEAKVLAPWLEADLVRLLAQREQERLLEEEYAASAPEDRTILKDFEHTTMDGLEHETW